MTEPTSTHQNRFLDRPSPSSLADVIELVLDKGLAIDAYVRVSVLGVELITMDARVVVTSVDMYLRFAEATNRLNLYEHETPVGELAQQTRRRAVRGAVRGVWAGVKEEFVETAEQVAERVAGDHGRRPL